MQTGYLFKLHLCRASLSLKLNLGAGSTEEMVIAVHFAFWNLMKTKLRILQSKNSDLRTRGVVAWFCICHVW